MTKCSSIPILKDKLEESISILELRISLNAQTIVPTPSKVIKQNCSDIDKLLQIKSIKEQNERAREAIEECLEAMDKLQFIKACISSVQTELLYDLFCNYNQFSREELEREIFKVASVLKTSQRISEANL